jgi:hypothetical protein
LIVLQVGIRYFGRNSGIHAVHTMSLTEVILRGFWSAQGEVRQTLRCLILISTQHHQQNLLFINSYFLGELAHDFL